MCKMIYNKNLGLEKSEELIQSMYKRQTLSDKRTPCYSNEVIAVSLPQTMCPMTPCRALRTWNSGSRIIRQCGCPSPMGRWLLHPASAHQCHSWQRGETQHHSSGSLAMFIVWAGSKRGTMGGTAQSFLFAFFPQGCLRPIAAWWLCYLDKRYWNFSSHWLSLWAVRLPKGLSVCWKNTRSHLAVAFGLPVWVCEFCPRAADVSVISSRSLRE